MIPRVSIGLPVHNGETFLREAVDSVLAQTYGDWELIISDNASTDATSDIARAYAAADSRISYSRLAVNAGASANFNRVAVLGHGEYFKWLAADDALEPEFLERCVPLLDADPSAALAFPRIRVRDEFTGTLRDGTFPYDIPGLDSDSPQWRFRQICVALPSIYPIFGLIRRKVLQGTHLLAPFIGADGCLLMELAMRGKFRHIPEDLLIGRWHRDSYGCRVGTLQRHGKNEGAEQARWYSPNNRRRFYFPYWHRLWWSTKLVLGSSHPPAEKFSMLGVLLHVAFWWRKALLRELRPSGFTGAS